MKTSLFSRTVSTALMMVTTIVGSGAGFVQSAGAAHQLGGFTIQNSGVSIYQVAPGEMSVSLASFELGNATNETLQLQQITIVDRNYANTGSALQSLGSAFYNLRLMKDGTQVAPTVETFVSDASDTQYVFTVSSLQLAPWETQTLRIDADVRAGASWRSTHRILIGNVRGVSVSSGAGYYTENFLLQSIVVRGARNNGNGNSGNRPNVAHATGALRMTVDNSSPAERYLGRGWQGQTLGAWQLSADGVESIAVSRFDVVNITSIGSQNLRNLSLWVDGVRVGGVLATLDVNNRARFEGLNIVVPRNGSVVVSVRADIASVAQGGIANVPVVMQTSVYGTISGAFIDPIVARGTISGNYPRVFGPAVFTANAQYAF